MARRVLAAVALLALGLAGAASAGLLTRGAIGAAVPATGSTPCASVTTVTTSPACTTTAAAVTTATTTTTVQTITTSTAASTLVITGHGWGHAMGMSQWGAYGYATHGWSFRRILQHYYPGTTIAKGPSPTIRVLLVDRAARATVGSDSPWRVVDGNGTVVELPAGQLVVPATLQLGTQTLVSPLRFTPGTTPVKVGKLAYRGELLVVSNGKLLQVVNSLPLESYLDGVVGSEMPDYWPQAALQAQAVAARSYALAELQNIVKVSSYDLYGDARSQVYGGIAAELPGSTRAVAATARRVVTYAGKVATTYYSSSTGGRTASAAEELGTPVPYLVSVADPYDVLAPKHDWGPVLVGAREAGKVFGLGGPLLEIGTVPSPSGHAATVNLLGPNGTTTLTGPRVRDLLGLRSCWFEFGWLTLKPPAAPVTAGTTVVLEGVARVAGDVTLEARTKGTPWAAVSAVTRDPTGVFTVEVEPTETTQYRLSSGTIRGALIRVTVVS